MRDRNLYVYMDIERFLTGEISRMPMYSGFVTYLAMKKGLFIKNRENERWGIKMTRILLEGLANKGRARYNIYTRSISPYPEAHSFILQRQNGVAPKRE